MMITLKRGERFNLSKNGLFNFQAKIEWNCSNCEIDSTIFLLDKNGKAKDENVIFFNNPNGVNNSIKLENDLNQKRINFDLNKLPNDIETIVLTLTVDTSQDKISNFGKVSNLNLNILGNNQNIIYQVEKFTNETAITLIEIYKKSNEWRLKSVGTGFISGLAKICNDFGISVDDELLDEDSTQPLNSSPKIIEKEENIIKQNIVVDLKKYGNKAKISLNKDERVTAKLKWNTNADLDLYCFYVDEFDNEDKIYYRRVGNLDNSPYIKLLGDSQSAGEEIIVFSKPSKIKYALICAYSALSNGIGSFYSYKAKVEVTDGNSQSVTTHLSYKDPFSYWVALAFIDFSKNGEITIENVETYSNRKTFKKQFKERTGSDISGFFKKSKASVNDVNIYDPERSPYLFKDGTFMMSIGTVEFK